MLFYYVCGWERVEYDGRDEETQEDLVCDGRRLNNDFSQESVGIPMETPGVGDSLVSSESSRRTNHMHSRTTASSATLLVATNQYRFHLTSSSHGYSRRLGRNAGVYGIGSGTTTAKNYCRKWQ